MKTDNKGMTIMEVLISVCIIAIVLILLFSLLLQVRSEDTDNNIQSTFILTQATMIKAIEEDIIDYGLRSIEQCNYMDVLKADDRTNMANQSDVYCVQLNYGEFSAEEDNIYEKDNTGILLVYEYVLKYDVLDDGSIKPSDERGIINGVKYSAWMIRYMRGNYVDQTQKVNNSKKQETRDVFKAKTTIMKELPDQIIMSSSDALGNTTYYEPSVKYSGYFGNNMINSGLLTIPIVTSTGEHYDIDISFEYKLPMYQALADDKCERFKYFSCRHYDDTDFCNLTNTMTMGKDLLDYSLNSGRPTCSKS